MNMKISFKRKQLNLWRKRKEETMTTTTKWETRNECEIIKQKRTFLTFICFTSLFRCFFAHFWRMTSSVERSSIRCCRVCMTRVLLVRLKIFLWMHRTSSSIFCWLIDVDFDRKLNSKTKWNSKKRNWIIHAHNCALAYLSLTRVRSSARQCTHSIVNCERARFRLSFATHARKAITLNSVRVHCIAFACSFAPFLFHIVSLQTRTQRTRASINRVRLDSFTLQTEQNKHAKCIRKEYETNNSTWVTRHLLCWLNSMNSHFDANAKIKINAQRRTDEWRRKQQNKWKIVSAKRKHQYSSTIQLSLETFKWIKRDRKMKSKILPFVQWKIWIFFIKLSLPWLIQLTIHCN